MDYSKNLQELVSRMEENLKIAKNQMSTKIVHNIHMVSGVLEMLDSTYFQEENGVGNVGFSGLSKPISDDEISIQPCVYEPSAVLHSFQIRPDCFIAGYMNLTYNGKAYPMFNIKPLSTNNITGSEFRLFATSNCDDGPNVVEILVKLDSKKRISRISIQNIKFIDFPNVRSEFLSFMNGHMDNVHVEDVRTLSNSLAYKYALANIPSNRESKFN